MSSEHEAPWWEQTTWQQPHEVDGDFYAIRVEADRDLDDEEARQLFACIGYAFRQHMRGESLGFPQRIAPNAWVAWYDSTKSVSDDWFYHFDDAIGAAKVYAIDGSPPRKTKGNTRLVSGLGRIAIHITFG